MKCMALEYTCAAIVLSTLTGAQAGAPPAQNERRAPLAYVRRVAMPPVTVGPSLSGLTDVRPKQAEEETRVREFAAKAAQIVTEDLQRRIARSGVSVITVSDGRDVPQDGRAPGFDAKVTVALDRLRFRTDFSREVWIRLRCDVTYTDENRPTVTAYAVGTARAAPRLVARGFFRSDEVLVAEAAGVASANLYRSLDKGYTSPLHGEQLIGIAPVAVSPEDVISWQTGGVATVRRMADVLLQPDLGPLAVVLPAADVIPVLQALRIQPEWLWRGLRPNVPPVVRLGVALGADLIVLGRLVSLTSGRPSGGRGDPNGGEGVRARVAVAIVNVGEQSVVYSTKCSGEAMTALRTKSGSVAVRRPEQAVLDAVLDAFGAATRRLQEWAQGRVESTGQRQSSDR